MKTKSCKSVCKLLRDKGVQSLELQPELQAHIAECPSCFAYLEKINALESSLHDLPEYDASDALIASTLQHLEKQQKPRVMGHVTCAESGFKNWFNHQWYWGGAIATTCVCLIAFIFMVSDLSVQTPAYEKMGGDQQRYAKLKNEQRQVYRNDMPTDVAAMDNENENMESEYDGFGYDDKDAAAEIISEEMLPSEQGMSQPPQSPAPQIGRIEKMPQLAMKHDDLDTPMREGLYRNKMKVLKDSKVDSTKQLSESPLLAGKKSQVRAGAESSLLAKQGEKDRGRFIIDLDKERAKLSAAEKKRSAMQSKKESMRRIAAQKRAESKEENVRKRQNAANNAIKTAAEDESFSVFQEEQDDIASDNRMAQREPVSRGPGGQANKPMIRYDRDENVDSKPKLKSKSKLNASTRKSHHVWSDFLKKRNQIIGLNYQEPAGYWANTYIPGDPDLRKLISRLKPQTNLLAKHKSRGLLDQLAAQYWQPFDEPKHAALNVFLHADKAYIKGQTRMLLQVGIKASAKQTGQRTSMNIAVVINPQQALTSPQYKRLEAILMALSKARQTGDQFSLYANGKQLIKPGDFRYGPISVALKSLKSTQSKSQLLPATLQRAITDTKQMDNPNSPLGTNLVLLITTQSSNLNNMALSRMVHQGAVAGVPVSVLSIDQKVNPVMAEKIVLTGQGHHRIVLSPDQAEPIIKKELYASSRTVARAVRLRIRLQPHVKLVAVIGSRKLTVQRAQQQRDIEQSIDQRLSRAMGIKADRGEDEEGIQIIIPAFYASDSHVILLDVVTEKAGEIADVTARYKDLVYLKNNVSRAHLELVSKQKPSGYLQYYVLKNYLAWQLSDTMKKAAGFVAENRIDRAKKVLSEKSVLLDLIQQNNLFWTNDPEFQQDSQMLSDYLDLINHPSIRYDKKRRYLADSMMLSGYLKLLSVVVSEVDKKLELPQ